MHASPDSGPDLRPLAEVVAHWARERPGGPAFIDGAGILTWAGYAESSDRLARLLVASGLERGSRVAVLLPDSRGVHIALLALEKAGLVAVGIGPRAGEAEIRHLLGATGARGLVSHARHRNHDMASLVGALRGEGAPLDHHWVVEGELSDSESLPGTASEEAIGSRGFAPDEVFLLNSTSGTTGLPKCVQHHLARWYAFHGFALRTGRLSSDDVFMSVVPAPFGFGIWTSHVTPTLLGAPTVLLDPFDPDETLRLLERHRVSVLAAVSTQFILLLDSPLATEIDWTHLRALYTGGERVPYERAAEFEERTGASVLQFYGSNESGALSGTSLGDSREKRLRTAGRVLPEMNVRLFDAAGRDVTASGRGEPSCLGPTLSRGYFEDPGANAELFREDGSMRVSDIVEIDAEGYLTVVGRTGDFIIRGGKNVSGPAVEEAVAAHADVALVAAVAMPDPVFGERVCAYVELRPGRSLTLDALVEDLRGRGVSKESWPERLEVVAELPRGSGGKIAKQVLREDIRRRLAQESAAEDDGRGAVRE